MILLAKNRVVTLSALLISKSRVDEVIICKAKPFELVSLNTKISLVKYMIIRERFSCGSTTNKVQK